MNVLEVVGICGGGVGRHLKSFIPRLVEAGHSVTVVYTPHGVDGSFQEYLNSDGLDNVRSAPLDIRREINPASDVRALASLARIARRNGPFDLIHGHSAKGGVLARIAGRVLRIPTVYTPHSLLSSSPVVSRRSALVYTTIERILGWVATDRLIAVSSEELRFVLAKRIAPKRRAVLIHNGVEETDLAAAVPLDGSVPLTVRPITFFSAMRFVEQKDPMNLIRAFAGFVGSDKDLPVRLIVAGDGEMLPQFVAYVAENGLSEKVAVLGWRPDVSELLRDSDIFVVSSLYEGFSYSIIEAMAAMRPVVSTEVFGTEETLARVPGNVLVEPGSPDELAEGLSHMAKNGKGQREILRQVGIANHEWISANFRQSRIAAQTIALYEEVVRKG